MIKTQTPAAFLSFLQVHEYNLCPEAVLFTASKLVFTSSVFKTLFFVDVG
jgi:hypothetical protein